MDKFIISIDKVIEWRKGQTLFNFLEWLAVVKKYPTEQSHRMADPFYIKDKLLDELYNEYMEEIKKAYGELKQESTN